jgi:xylulokinase
MMDQIKDVPAGSRGVIFTPWLHGNRNPFEDPNARGMFFGLGIESTSVDMVHAVIEGVCLHLKWQMTAMEKLTPTSEVIRFVGGGALAPLTCQILADVLGKKVETVDSPQNAGSVGAAALMGIGLGLYESFKDVKESVPVTASYEPRKENTEVYEELFVIFKDLYKNNKKNFSRLRKGVV